ncbi:hypothetical protein MTR67_002656 [Solanum verrucosum]|uniref:Very-long-chain 3-oxoacyl-CoA synthase n=1 Tax=Solanum verrucosum TaxID=315347 RepID=A0AAF0PR95_SOLVR|nr:hypothetical protein MTR67_002656 [Solanum verrucosum]
MIHVGVITNASVHVIMYAYYFFCASGKRPGWKKIVTSCQILQFILYFMGAVVVMYYDHLTTKIGAPGARTLFFNVTFNTSLFLLFLNFHSKSYANNIIKHSQHKASQ